MGRVLEGGPSGRRPTGALLAQVAGMDPLAPLPHMLSAGPDGSSLMPMSQSWPSMAPMQLNVPNVTLPQGRPAPRHSKGQIIAGIIADGLAGALGRPPAVANMWAAEREREQEQAKWGLQRSARLEDYEAQKQIDQRYDTPDISPMERDLAVWSGLTQEQRAAYQQMKQMGAPDPDVFTTLPNKQFYAGPRSGLATALSGGGPAPNRPAVGSVMPDPRKAGGAGGNASGGFRR